MMDIKTRRLFAIASLALRYPERDWLKSFEDIESELENFDGETSDVLWTLLSHFASQTLMDLQINYVDTFDRKRRAGLYLSYYLNGDTRKRGTALLAFKHTYMNEGWEIISDELADFLPMLLEFTAVSASPAGMQLLIDHRPGIALLEIALRDMKSPYAGLVKVLLKAIPGTDLTGTLKLIEQGPPIEMVGLAPYGAENPEKIEVGAK